MFGVLPQYLYVATVLANLANSKPELIWIVFFKKTQNFYFHFL